MIFYSGSSLLASVFVWSEYRQLEDDVLFWCRRSPERTLSCVYSRLTASTYLRYPWLLFRYCSLNKGSWSQIGLVVDALRSFTAPESLPPFQLNRSTKSRLHVQVNNILFLPKSSVVSIHLTHLKQIQFPSQPSSLRNYNSNHLLP